MKRETEEWNGIQRKKRIEWKKRNREKGRNREKEIEAEKRKKTSEEGGRGGVDRKGRRKGVKGAKSDVDGRKKTQMRRSGFQIRE